MPEHMRFAFYAMAVRVQAITLLKQLEAEATGTIKTPYEEL
jgi:hypothetical protein